MKYNLNKLEPKTTNNFKINDFEIELQIPKIEELKEYDIESTEEIKVNSKIKNSILKTKIGLSFPKYLELNITIPKNIKIEKTIKITKRLTEKIFPSKINIHCEENSSANIIIDYQTQSSEESFGYIKECVTTNKNANISITYWNHVNDKSINMIAYEGVIDEQATLKHNLLDTNGNIRIYNADIEAKEYQSRNIFNMIYLGKDNNKIDINYNFKNIGIQSINQLTVEGMLNDTAEKNFRGTIDFKKGSSNSIGQEQENCVLLSNSCKSRSLPMLLCEEDNVIGSHGESSGKVSEEKLFYLMSRGFTKKEAERFIVLANFQSIIKEIPDESLQEEIIEHISRNI